MSNNNDERKVTITSRQLVFALLCLSYVYVISIQAPITMGWISNQIFNVTTDKTEYYFGDTVAIYVTGAVPTTRLVFQVYDSNGDPVIVWQSLASTIGTWSGGASTLGTFTELWKVVSDIQSGTYTLMVEDVWGERSVQTNFSVRIDVQPYISDFNWTLTEPIPGARRNSSTFIHNDMIFLIGGDDDAYGSLSDTYFSRITQNGTIGNWTETTELPIDLDNTQCVVYGPLDTLYVIGGTQSSKTSPIESDRVYYSSIKQDGLGTWQNTTSLPGVRTGHAAVIWKNRVFVIGGWSGKNALSSVYSGKVEADGSILSWTSMSDLPQARWMHTAFVYKDWIYVLGDHCLNKSIYRAKISYDGNLGAWNTISSLPTGLWGVKSVVMDERIYLVGGSSVSDWVPSNQVISAELYVNGNLGTWRNEKSLPNSLAGHSAVSYEDIMYVVGGSTTASDPHDFTDLVYYSSHDHELLSVIIGNGSLVPPDGFSSYEHGSEVSITAIPAEGWELIHWELNVNVLDRSTSMTVTMDRTHLLVAVFWPIPDDNIKGAIDLELGTPYEAEINPGLDEDYYSLNATPGHYSFSTSGMLDTYIHLIDSDGETEIASDDDSGEDFNARILWQCTNPGVYYIRVRGYDESVTGNYSVLVYNSNASASVARGNWNISLRVEVGAYSALNATFGMNEEATDGFNDTAGDLILPPGYSGVESYFYHPENPSSPVDLRKLYVSYQPVEYPANWTFKVHTFTGISGETTLSWTASNITNIPSDHYVHLYTPTGAVNMREASQYTWTADEATTYTFTVMIDHGIKIDQTRISDSRVDVGTTQTVSFHGYWLANSSDVTAGTFYVNEVAYPVNSTGWVNFEVSREKVGQLTWTVTGVQCGDVTSFSQDAADPAIIWDMVEVYDGGASPERVGSLVNSTVWFKARYSYDFSSLNESTGQISVNSSEMTWSESGDRWELNVSCRKAGNVTYVVTDVSEVAYGLSSFTDITEPVTVYFTGEWSAFLSVDVAGSIAGIVLGMKEDATVGFDAGVGDALVTPAPPYGVWVYINYPNNPTSPVDLQKLSTSLLPVEYPAEWTLKVQTIGVSGEASINWSSSEIDAIPVNYTVTLDTPSGGVDMRSVGNYSWNADADTTYTFMISITSEVENILQLKAGWNMVSLPVIPEDFTANAIIPSGLFFQLVTWSGSGYVSATEFEAGRGYWLLVLEDVNVTVSGVPVDSLSLSLSPGWSMVGGTNDVVTASDVFPGFYQLVMWTGTGYTPATVFEPGKGYWALVLEETQIQLPPA